MKTCGCYFGLVLCILLPFISRGQDQDPGPSLAKLRTDIIPHSPEAEAMAKYDVLPVTLYSGMVNISVPVFDIKSPSLDLSFSLSYNYNGYKPNEIPSYAGLGWSFQGGGCITRIVKGQVDESMSTNGHYDEIIAPTFLTWNQQFLAAAGSNTVDLEPDLYIFHVGAYSGKFIMIKGKAFLFPYQNIQITGSPTSGFRMVDDKGNVYTFNDAETTYHKASSPAGNVPVHKSAWYVSKIISADTKDTVSFSYIGYSYKQPSTLVETYTINGFTANGFNTSGHTMAETNFDGDHIDALLLSSVNSKYGSIFCNASGADRLDAPGSTGAKVLDNITVFGPDGAYSKQLQLYHSYFGSGYNVRLNLQSVTVLQYSPITDSSNYYFQYAGSTSSIPDNATKGIDLWGYYNGANNNAMLFPSGTFTPHLYNYADRSANMNYSQIGMLTKITYPTGGYAQITYEPNQAGHYYPAYTFSPITYSKTVTYDPQNQTAGITTQTRLFSNTLNQWVKISENNQNDNTIPANVSALQIIDAKGVIRYASPAGQEAYSDSVLLPPGSYTLAVQCPSTSSPVTGNATFSVASLDYTNSTLADAPGLRVKQITSYDNTSNGSLPLLTKNYFYNEGAQLTSDGISGASEHADCAGYSITTYQSGINSSLSDLASTQFYYQQVTETSQDPTQTGKTVYSYGTQNNYVMDVKQLTRTDYQYLNNNYIPVKSLTSTYQTTTRNNFNAYRVHVGTVIGQACTSCSFCPMLQSPDPTQAADLLQAYSMFYSYSLPSTYSLMTQQADAQYDNLGNLAKQKITNYYYDNPDHLWPTRIASPNSKGEVVTAYMKYPLDYTFGSCTSPTTNNNTFVANVAAAGQSAGDCLSNEEIQLQPYEYYHNNTAQNQSSFTSIANMYNCRSSLQTGIASATTANNTAWTNYQTCLTNAISSNSVAWQKGVLWMEQNNMVSPVIEKYITVKKSDGNEYLISATRNEYNILTNAGSAQCAFPSIISQAELGSTLLLSSFTSNPDNYYKPQVFFAYDTHFNLITQNKVNDKRESYLWNYQNVFPVAKVVNSDAASIAFTSFEGDFGGWTFSGMPVADATAVTGRNSYLLNGSNGLSKGALSASNTYFLSYWTKNASAFTITGTQTGYPLLIRAYNGWKCFEHKITGQTSVTVNGSGQLDEIRLYPSTALMNTYTYSSVVGLTATCDENNRINYYFYDGTGRLKVIKDQDGNIVKTIDYHYQPNP